MHIVQESRFVVVRKLEHELGRKDNGQLYVML